MHALILAGGEGSRLLASGVTSPKALVPIGGTPQLLRLLLACQQVGCEAVTCAIREDLVPLAAPLVLPHGGQVVAVRTPNSLHTLVAGLGTIPNGPVFCTLVDSVVREDDWILAHQTAFELLRDADAVVAVTPHVADESPLWVDVAEDGTVRAFGRRGDPALVTGGVYWFSPAARAIASAVLEAGAHRLREFLAQLVESGGRVRVVVIPRMIDVDTSDDLREAREMMEVGEP